MANTSDQDWDITAPADADPRRDGAEEVRVLRGAISVRMDKEHTTLEDGDEELGTGGGEHRQGSAKAYYTDTEPTERPNTDDYNLPLDADDDGRIWIDTTDDNNIIMVWDNDTGAFVACQATASGQYADGFGEFTGVAVTVESADVVLTYTARRVVINNTYGSTGHGAVFILPEATGAKVYAYCEVWVGASQSRNMRLTREADDLTLTLTYIAGIGGGAQRLELDGTWQYYAAGAGS